MAAVPELTARAYRAPTASANSSSNRLVFFPVVSHPDRSVSTTSAISSSPTHGSANGRKFLVPSFPIRIELLPKQISLPRAVGVLAPDNALLPVAGGDE